MLVPRSRPTIRDISSSLRVKSKTSRFCLTRSLRTDFGMTTTPRWIVHRRAIWATDLSCESAMPTSVGLVKKPFFPSAKAPQDSICTHLDLRDGGRSSRSRGPVPRPPPRPRLLATRRRRRHPNRQSTPRPRQPPHHREIPPHPARHRQHRTRRTPAHPKAHIAVGSAPPFASASAALSAHTRPYRQGVTAEGSLSMRELFGHRVELPTSPCVAGNTSGVKRRRRDGARASEGTASRPRDAAGSGLGRLFICWHECQLGLSDDLPSKLSQLTKPAHPRVPQSDRRMQRLGGGAAAVVRQESSPRRLCAQHHACGARQLDPVMGNRRNTTGTPRVRVALSEMRRPRAGLQRPRRSRLPTIRTSPGDGLGHRHLGAAQGRRFVPLATKLDIPTANGVSIAIGLSGGDSGGWRLGPLGR